MVNPIGKVGCRPEDQNQLPCEKTMGQILLPCIGVRGNGNLLVKASSKSSTTTSAKASLSQSCHGHAQERVEAANPCALRFKLAMKPLTYPWTAEESNWPKLEQRLRVLAVYWFHWFYVLQRDETTATHKVPKALRSLSLGSRSKKWRLLDQSILHPSSSEVDHFQ